MEEQEYYEESPGQLDQTLQESEPKLRNNQGSKVTVMAIGEDQEVQPDCGNNWVPNVFANMFGGASADPMPEE